MRRSTSIARMVRVRRRGAWARVRGMCVAKLGHGRMRGSGWQARENGYDLNGVLRNHKPHLQRSTSIARMVRVSSRGARARVRVMCVDTLVHGAAHAALVLLYLGGAARAHVSPSCARLQVHTRSVPRVAITRQVTGHAQKKLRKGCEKVAKL